MKITRVEDFHVDGGWDTWGYLRVSTDAGIVGWSEFSEKLGRRGVALLLRDLAETLIGKDPRQLAEIVADLYRDTRGATGGLRAMTIGAIENALLDLKARAIGIPVYELLGGKLRDRIPVYWSHCGLYRSKHPSHFANPVRTLDDVRALAREVADSGYKALKTNLLTLTGKDGVAAAPGIARGTDRFGMNIESSLIDRAVELIGAFHDGSSGRIRLMLDLNFNYKTEGFRQMAKALEPFNMLWLEVDTHDAEGLALLRQGTTTPIASLETIFGRRALRPFLERRAVDVGLIDAVFNGALESNRMASMFDAYEVNVAAHNSSSPLGSLINAHFCASIPNFRIMEYDVDEVAWRKELAQPNLVIESGELVLPTTPGWGIEMNEEAIRAHQVYR